MSDDLPIPHGKGRSAEVTTVRWGSGEPTRRGRPARLLADLSRDPRVPLVVAGLGALATFAAMTGDWTITTLPHSGPDGGPASLKNSVSELGNLGGGYLFGTLTLLGCLALVLFGSAGVRHNARIVGLAMAVGTGGVLLAVTVTLENSSRALFLDPGDDIVITHDRGLVMAYVATAAFAVALLLAAPFTRAARLGTAAVGAVPGTDPAGAPVATDPAGAPVGTLDAGPDWPWRRPRASRPEPDDESLPPPADLTVAPAPPFTRPEAPFTRSEAPFPRPEAPFPRSDGSERSGPRQWRGGADRP